MANARRRVDARDVLDANATVARGFRARLLGSFRQTGPNAWDDFDFVPQEPEEVDVLAGTPVQLEDEGAVVRLRRHGKVIVVSWRPEPGDVDERADPRGRFVERFLSDEDPTPEGNLGAWLHAELKPKSEAKD
jgi:hypothetical protein